MCNSPRQENITLREIAGGQRTLVLTRWGQDLRAQMLSHGVCTLHGLLGRAWRLLRLRGNSDWDLITRTGWMSGLPRRCRLGSTPSGGCRYKCFHPRKLHVPICSFRMHHEHISVTTGIATEFSHRLGGRCLKQT
jgi:hypothetical protein